MFAFILIMMNNHVVAKITVSAEYHQPTDLFALMDGVSNWYFNDDSYRKAWVDRFGLSSNDKKIIKFYRNYRDRTYYDRAQKDKKFRKNQDGIFAARSSYSLKTDPLAEHFINSITIEQALSSLDNIASSADASKLRVFYENFRLKWAIILSESKEFSSHVQTLNDGLKGSKVEDFLTRVSAFYRVDLDLKFRARFVWWPPIDRTLADVSGNTVFLRVNPLKQVAEGNWAEIVMHELVHYISAHQPVEQKRFLSDEFLKICPVKKNNLYEFLFKRQKPYDFLEEPMAIAWGQAAFAKYVQGQSLDPAKDWYSRPLAEVMGRLIWLEVESIYDSEVTIDEKFIQRIAKNCSRVLSIN
ncbi:MAG: hypothetical protein ACI9SP_000860 [Arenicella sp.]